MPEGKIFTVNGYGATIYYACGVYVAVTLLILYVQCTSHTVQNRRAGDAQGGVQDEPEGGDWKNAMESCSRPSSAITHTCRGHYASLKRLDRPYYVRRGPPLVGPLGRAGAPPPLVYRRLEYNFRRARR